jgi:hypothetical protein
LLVALLVGIGTMLATQRGAIMRYWKLERM